MIERHFHDLIFNGKSLADFGVHVSGDKAFTAPEKDFETVEVPGRSGDLHFFKNRYKNMNVSYDAFIVGDGLRTGSNEEEFKRQMIALRGLLMSSNGYRRLEDTYHDDEYRMALYQGPFEPEDVILLQASHFTLTFNCKPQRFLKLGEKEVEFTASGSIVNPTSFPSKPLIRVYGNGALGIGSETLTIKNNASPNYIDIDCEQMDCYRGSDNMNDNVTLSSGDFPVLEAGQTGISLVSGMRVIITPRWWRL